METVKSQDLNKQINGCMPSFFNIFDRSHLLSPKRFSLPKCLASSSPVTINDSETLRSSPPNEILTTSLLKQEPISPWRFSKEAPRLSLDSRAVVDAKGSLKPKQIRAESGSTSVITRLMGLEALPQQPLMRSASESRVSKVYSFVDSFSLVEDLKESAQPERTQPSRKSLFDSGDFFPKPKQIHRGVEKAPSDLETLKQLLEALQLKGLLHSSRKQQSHRVFIRSGVSPPASPRRDARNKAPTFEQQKIVSPLPWRRPERLQTRKGGKQDKSVIGWRSGEEVKAKPLVDKCDKQGKALLERCDKLLHSIAEMAAATEVGELQLSPVSVLDASFNYEESSPSPVVKRNLDFVESEEESWGGSEYVYILDILRASDCLPQDSDIFSLLEKQQVKCASRAATQERRLIFDAVQEIIGRRRRLPPWITVEEANKMQVIWSEFQKIRSKKPLVEEEEDVVGYVCGVLGRDLAEDRWRECQVEKSEAVLDIERLIYKDLIGETIRHMACLNRPNSLRRKLVF